MRDASPSPVAGRVAPPTSTTSTSAPGPTPEERCAEALESVAGAGLALLRGAGYRCSSTLFPHHGASCWYAADCPNARFNAINTGLMGEVSPAYRHYVVSHEICHLMHVDAGQSSTEDEADACAAAHGAPAG